LDPIQSLTHSLTPSFIQAQTVTYRCSWQCTLGRTFWWNFC